MLLIVVKVHIISKCLLFKNFQFFLFTCKYKYTFILSMGILTEPVKALCITFKIRRLH